MTCLGSVLLLVLCSSLEPRMLLSLLSPELRCLLKGLYASLGATFIMTGTLSSLPRPYLVLFLLVSLGSCLLVRETFGTPSLDRIGELEADPGDRASSSDLRYEVRREEKPGDWTSVCSEVGRGLMDLLPGSVTGLGVLETGAGTEGLGPRPSFSLMAGESMDVKEANIMHFNE